jgi:hypothetical protein
MTVFILPSKLPYKFLIVCCGTFAKAALTATLNPSNVGQPTLFTYSCTHAQTFSIIFKSGMLGGQLGSTCTLQPCLALHFLTTSGAHVCVGSLSCCKYQVVIPLFMNKDLPPGERVPVKTCLYSGMVMFLAGCPFLFLWGDLCLLDPATTCMAVKPKGLMPAYRFKHWGSLG